MQGLRLALPQTLLLDALAPAVAAAFDRALRRLSQGGARIVELPMTELAEIAQINVPGGFSAVEACATHGESMQTQAGRYAPRVARRIALGAGVSAADYIRMLQRRRDWIGRVAQRLQGFDTLIAPTTPITAPAIADLQASDEAFFKANGLLLRKPLPVNCLDGCAFTLPCQAEGEWPVGLMLAAAGGQVAALAGVALAVEALQQGPF